MALPAQEFVFNAEQFNTLCAKIEGLTAAVSNVSLSVAPTDTSSIVQALHDLQNSRITIVCDYQKIIALGIQSEILGGP